MLDFISELYQYASVIPLINELSEACYQNNAICFLHLWQNNQEKLANFCQKADSENSVLGSKMFAQLNKISQTFNSSATNLIYIGDMIENMLHTAYSIMEIFGHIDVSADNIQIISSKSGYLTLKNIQTQIYYHSVNNPMWEAHVHAKSIYNPNVTEYHFLGCGLGYLPFQIFLESDQSCDIYIYHNSSKLLSYAFDYGVLDLIPENKLHLEISNDATELLKEFFNSDSNKSSLQCLGDAFDSFTGYTHDIIASYNSSSITANSFSKLAEINFIRNTSNVKTFINSLNTKGLSSDWLIVAGGPSTDLRMEFIRESLKTKTVICASTVARKLIECGIIPHFIAVSDPQARTYGHMAGIDTSELTLLMSIDANWRFSEFFLGKKYLIPCKGMPYKLEDSYGEPWDIGGTVSDLMIEIAAHNNAKTIELLGVDLSYPGGVSHASGTMDFHKVSSQGLLPIRSVNGQTVMTSYVFKQYIESIEKKIDYYKNDIVFINFSENGALITGARWYKE